MPETAPVSWQDGVLRSVLYGDIYFSAEGGLAESRAVFLQGCGLPDAWQGRRRFTVAELGFGTGLNIAALLELWSRTRPPGAILHIFSVEAHPMAREDAARALAGSPEIAEAAEALLTAWPGVRRGFHRLDLPAFGAILDLAVMEVGQALEQWRGAADAWFLDGFSPATNPDMWREEVLGLVAARSAQSARLATFTVAGVVRRGLEACGFEVTRQPGYGRKRERLEARLPGEAADPAPPGRIAIVGSGIGGAATLRALAALGVEAEVLEGEAPGASGNPAALVTPGLDASGWARARFYAAAFSRAVELYDQIPDAVIARGAALIETEARDPRRLAAVQRQDFFEPGSFQSLDARAAADWLGEAAGASGMLLSSARVIDPQMVLSVWLDGAARPAAVGRIEARDGGWRLHLADARPLDVEVVVVAAGWGSASLLPDLPLMPVRGQASWARLADPPRAASFGGYAIPTREGVLFGSTHDRDDTGCELRDEDHARNLAAIAGVRPRIAGRIDLAKLHGRAAIRASTADQMPVVGELAPGLYVFTGLGSRGFTTAPLLAEHLAATICGAPSPLPADISRLVEPPRL